ncbi:hypothetical protein ACFLS0_04130 [Candidatus Bipolaricaulota bacterium]
MYEAIALTYEKESEIFRELGKENAKNGRLIRRVYYEVVSDALETGFSFQDLQLSDSKYAVDSQLGERVYLEAVRMALENEDRIQQFYVAAAEQSRSLLADVKRVFEKLARQRTERRAALCELLQVT